MQSDKNKQTTMRSMLFVTGQMIKRKNHQFNFSIYFNNLNSKNNKTHSSKTTHKHCLTQHANKTPITANKADLLKTATATNSYKVNYQSIDRTYDTSADFENYSVWKMEVNQHE